MDIKRMEMAYHELNRREYELVKHVSLCQVNPVELLNLRNVGRCTLSIPEELFDMDCPGQYFRRIKSVAVSIPCVTGPYTSVSCKLTIVKSSIRKNSLLSEGAYEKQNEEDDRFSDYYGSMESIVTSTGQNDSGLFETNLHDERYLPFEGSGAMSEWRLELPADVDVRQFNYDTITDVILHIRYTAREGGNLLRDAAVLNLKNKINTAQAAGCVRFFSIRHEFPTEWANFKSKKIDNATKVAELSFIIREEHYPFWSKGVHKIRELSFYARTDNANVEITDTSGNKSNLDKPLSGLYTGRLLPVPQTDTNGDLVLDLNFTDNSMDDLWMTLTWGKAER
jgi:hypothetical protein